MLSRESIDEIVNRKPGSVEIILNLLQIKIAKYRERKLAHGFSASSSPHSHGVRSRNGTASKSLVKSTSSIQRNHNNYSVPEHIREDTRMAFLNEEIFNEREEEIIEMHETLHVLEHEDMYLCFAFLSLNVMHENIVMHFSSALISIFYII
jgi:hypothetical protein